MMNQRKIKTHEIIKIWRENPIRFVQDNFGVEPDDWQKDVLIAFPKHSRLCMLASKGVGKTTVLAWLVLNFMSTRPYPKCACTSITLQNLNDGLRSEIGLWISKSKFLQKCFTLTQTRLQENDHSQIWFLSFRAWSKSADSIQQSLTLAGLHADYMLFLCDEVGSYPEAIIATAEGALASGKEVKLVVAGNCTDVNGPLFRIANKDKADWHITKINSDPDNPKRSPRVSKEWAQKQIDTYGRDSSFVRVNVLGEFPNTGLSSLVSRSEVESSMANYLEPSAYEMTIKKLGVDVARFGEDSSVIFPRQGLMAFNPIQFKGARTQEIVTRITLSVSKWGAEQIFVDGTGGFGSGVVDSLLSLGNTPYECHFASKADDERFANKRTEIYFRLAEYIKRGGCLPNIPELKEEILAHTYSFNLRGQMIVDPKDHIKESLGRSPDLSDALALTFWNTDTIKGQMIDKIRGNNKLKYEYDPFYNE